MYMDFDCYITLHIVSALMLNIYMYFKVLNNTTHCFSSNVEYLHVLQGVI